MSEAYQSALAFMRAERRIYREAWVAHNRFEMEDAEFQAAQDRYRKALTIYSLAYAIEKDMETVCPSLSKP